MYTRIFFENYQYETIFDEINRNKTILIPEEIYHQYCVPGRLCKILIQIISFLPDKFVKFKIKAKENNIHYIEPNKIIIKGTTFLAFNHGRDVYVENLQKHINISDLQEFIKNL